MIFCAASQDDPGRAPIRAMLAAHPDGPARRLVGELRISAHPRPTPWPRVGAARRAFLMLLDSDLTGLRLDHLFRLAAPVLRGHSATSIGLCGNAPACWRGLGLDHILRARLDDFRRLEIEAFVEKYA